VNEATGREERRLWLGDMLVKAQEKVNNQWIIKENIE
jgi:hypothetical protein